MRLQVKANIPLNIRMCLECPFYRMDKCKAEYYLPDGVHHDVILILEDTKVIPDSCPLLRYENKK